MRTCVNRSNWRVPVNGQRYYTPLPGSPQNNLRLWAQTAVGIHLYAGALSYQRQQLRCCGFFVAAACSMASRRCRWRSSAARIERGKHIPPHAHPRAGKKRCNSSQVAEMEAAGHARRRDIAEADCAPPLCAIATRWCPSAFVAT